MTINGVIQILIYLATLTILSPILGRYIANVFEPKRRMRVLILSQMESAIYRVSRINAEEEMSWKRYAWALLCFNMIGLVAVYLLQRFQDVLPLNPAQLGAVEPHTAFNTATSFATNTNWQSYGGETTMSYFTQMVGLGVQNFVSAACGIAVLIALARAFTRHGASTIGNFWSDLTKSTVYVLLPLSFVLAIALISQGVVQTFSAPVEAHLLEATTDSEGHPVDKQVIPLGPAASQIAIKQLGTNGGGFYNVNSAHPLENPTPLSNFLEVFAILIISSALCFTFGEQVRDRRQGWALYSCMMLLFVLFLVPTVYYEQRGTPVLDAVGAELEPHDHSGGNMEGKEVRFGIANSALWAVATTAASNGSVNSMHDSFTPLGGMAPMVLMQLGEVVFGGVGSGLYGLIAFAIVTVFIAGLMVGRTPEYLGKKIESFEIKMVIIMVLLPCAVVLIATALGVSFDVAKASVTNPGPHGFSQVLYAYSSMGNNNGSAFAGFGANIPFHNYLGAIAMFLSRYWLMIPTLALAAALAKKKTVPPSLGTLPTHTPLFVLLLAGVVLIVGALSFFPALALGPIAEHVQVYRGL